ncbi:MAG TPA: glycosyl transferase family 2, partial [Micromonosporaceae bacterium]
MAVLTLLAGLSVLVWLWLTLMRGMFWRTDVRLPAGADPSLWPSVAVVIPARDEAEVLPAS